MFRADIAITAAFRFRFRTFSTSPPLAKIQGSRIKVQGASNLVA
jgi:hypothetical protein